MMNDLMKNRRGFLYNRFYILDMNPFVAARIPTLSIMISQLYISAEIVRAALKIHGINVDFNVYTNTKVIENFDDLALWAATYQENYRWMLFYYWHTKDALNQIFGRNLSNFMFEELSKPEFRALPTIPFRFDKYYGIYITLFPPYEEKHGFTLTEALDGQRSQYVRAVSKVFGKNHLFSTPEFYPNWAKRYRYIYDEPSYVYDRV